MSIALTSRLVRHVDMHRPACEINFQTHFGSIDSRVLFINLLHNHLISKMPIHHCRSVHSHHPSLLRSFSPGSKLFLLILVSVIAVDLEVCAGRAAACVAAAFCGRRATAPPPPIICQRAADSRRRIAFVLAGSS